MAAMEHVTEAQLYPLFYALVRHKAGEKRISKLQLDPELGRCVNGLPVERYATMPAEGDTLTSQEVRDIVKHAESCNECAILVLEDGAAAKRRRTEAELAKEKMARKSRDRKMVIKFFISLTYGIGCVIGANLASTKYQLIMLAERAKEGTTFKPLYDPSGGVHPLQILFVVLIFIAAWGLAECWHIANALWIDFDKFKGAVPVIGKAWQAKSRAKREQFQQAERDREQR